MYLGVFKEVNNFKKAVMWFINVNLKIKQEVKYLFKKLNLCHKMDKKLCF